MVANAALNGFRKSAIFDQFFGSEIASCSIRKPHFRSVKSVLKTQVPIRFSIPPFYQIWALYSIVTSMF